ncbi:MAG: chromosome partitioning protein ParB [Planctomycetes bacterium]|nr:chromosome partitioning protein ParB [Planctomycetota bacterium]
MHNHPEVAVSAVSELELAHLDLRYEGYRLRQPRLEAALLSAIAQEGIREPLLGVIRDGVPILLDGFKRCRCARLLHLHVAPFVSWGSDEVGGILKLLRADRQAALSLLEQAGFVAELHTQRGLSVAELAQQLGRSKAWVGLRLGLLQELSPAIREALFAGAFPVYSCLYSLRPVRRLKGVSAADLDQFVGALSGQKLSVRQIEGLAQGFFRGPASFRQEILAGHLSLALGQLAQAPEDPDGCSDFERIFLQDLEQTHKAMFRVMSKSQNPKLQSRAFLAQCNLLTAALLGRGPGFLRTLRQLHDRTGQT